MSKKIDDYNYDILGFLVSRVDNPLYISYNGETMCLPPRGTTKNNELLKKSLLGTIPKGVIFVEIA